MFEGTINSLHLSTSCYCINIVLPGFSYNSLRQKCEDYLNSQNLQFVPKPKKPPNLPQCRPIERYWALAKSKYSQQQQPPKSIAGFSQVWRNVSREVAQNHGKQLMEGVRRKLRSVSRKGLQQAVLDGDL